MIEVRERSIFVRISCVVAPLWLVGKSVIELNVFLDNGVWGGFSVIKVAEWTVLIRVACIVTPFWLVFLLSVKLHIFLYH